MGAWGITMRESDYGLDLLMSIEDRQTCLVVTFKLTPFMKLS